MARKRGGLGRGLNALFPEEPLEEEKTSGSRTSVNDTNDKISSAVSKAGSDSPDGALNRNNETEKASAQNIDSSIVNKIQKSDSNLDSYSDTSGRNIDNNHVDYRLTANDNGQKEQTIIGDSNIRSIRLFKIEPDPSQPRKNFTEEELDQLAASIKEHGLLQPIIVTPQEGTDRYLIVAGERRWRACQRAGLPTIQAIVRVFDNKQDQLEASLIENIQREDLNPVEEAAAYQRLMKEFHLTQEEVAQKVSRSRAAVANSLRLLKLAPDVQDMVIDGKLSMGQARALISIEDPSQQLQIAEQVESNDLSVREVEKLIKNLGKTHKHVSRETDPSLAAVYKDVQNKMEQSLGLGVKISYKNDKSGKVEISFSNDEDLEKIMSKIF